MRTMGEKVLDYRYRAFHKTGYQVKMAASMSSVARTTVLPSGAGSLQKDYRIVRQFHGPGVERNAEQPLGFVYGSDTSYNPTEENERKHGSNKASAETVKVRRQQMEAEACLQERREAALRLQQERALEKKQDLEMLQQYNPWGKPAAGAPRVDSQGEVTATRQKLDFVQTNPTGDEEELGYNPFGRPGAGAPKRTDSGRVVTSVRRDPETRFQKQLKQEVEGSLRYMEPNRREKHHLPWEVQLQRQKEQEERFLCRSDSDRMRIMAEKEKQLSYARRLGQQRIEELERKANEKTDKQSAVPVYHPWGRDQVERDDSGKIAGRRWVVGKEVDPEGSQNSTSEYVSLASQMGRLGGGGAPLGDSCGHVQTKRSHADVSTAGQPEDQWGRPGAGAPLRGADGHPVTTIYGKCYREKHGTDRLLVETLEYSRKSKELETKRVLKGHGMDIASWVRAGVVGQPHRNPKTGLIVAGSRSTSDTTTECTGLWQPQAQDYCTDLQRQAEERRQARHNQRETDKLMELEHTEKVAVAGAGGGRSDNSRRKEYCNELQRMMTERSEQKRRSREEDVAREKQHVELFAQQWGRPGGGAPRTNEHGQVDTTPKTFSSLLETHVYTGRKFRRV